MSLISLRETRVIAHRGASGSAPENTVIAMRKAQELGATWVEFDVMLAGCGKVIVMHDDNLERTSGLNRLVVDTTFEEMQQLDVGSWFSPQFKGEKIPSFRQLIGYLKDLSMEINIEIKPVVGKEHETVDRLLEVLFEVWPIESRPPLLSSQDIEVLRSLRKQAPQLDVSCVIHSWHEHWRDWVEEVRCVAASVFYEIITPQMLQQLKEVVPLAFAYTVNDPGLAEKLYAWGVDAVFTDHPELITEAKVSVVQGVG